MRGPKIARNAWTGEAMLGNLEEHINNPDADVELARQRYEMFCEKVVKRMLP
jgi:hypothetical protein